MTWVHHALKNLRIKIQMRNSWKKKTTLFGPPIPAKHSPLSGIIQFLRRCNKWILLEGGLTQTIPIRFDEEYILLKKKKSYSAVSGKKYGYLWIHFEISSVLATAVIHLMKCLRCLYLKKKETSPRRQVLSLSLN